MKQPTETARWRLLALAPAVLAAYCGQQDAPPATPPAVPAVTTAPAPAPASDTEQAERAAILKKLDETLKEIQALRTTHLEQEAAREPAEIPPQAAAAPAEGAPPVASGSMDATSGAVAEQTATAAPAPAETAAATASASTTQTPAPSAPAAATEPPAAVPATPAAAAEPAPATPAAATGAPGAPPAVPAAATETTPAAPGTTTEAPVAAPAAPAVADEAPAAAPATMAEAPAAAPAASPTAPAIGAQPRLGIPFFPTQTQREWRPNTVSEGVSVDSKRAFFQSMMMVSPLSMRDMVSVMAYKKRVKEGLTFEDVVEAMRIRANAVNFKQVGHNAFWKDVKAITGKDTPRVEIFQFCDAVVGQQILNYAPEFVVFLPCRIAVLEDADGRLWVMTLDWDVTWLDYAQNPNSVLDANLRAEARRIRDAMEYIIEGGATGEW